MDNTLFDLVGAKQAACREVAAFLGERDGEALFSYFLRPVRGFEDPQNIRDYLQDRGLFSDAAFRECAGIYQEVKLREIVTYPGVAETLAVLSRHGFPLALVTDAHQRDAVPRLEKIALLNRFDCVVTHDMTWQKKPSVVPFLYALQRLGADPPGTIVIGDSPRRDIAPARSLGMRTVYARYGDRFSQTRGDGGAEYVIDDIRELLALLGCGTGPRGEGGGQCAAGLPSR